MKFGIVRAMVDDYTEKLGQGLAFEDYIPLKWELASAEIDEIKLCHINETNEEIIQSLFVIDRVNFDSGDEDSESHNTELLKLDQKLNIMLDLIMQLLRQQQSSPMSYLVRLTPQHVIWQTADDIPQIDSHIFIDLFLQRNYPRSVRFYGTIDSIEEVENNTVMVTVKLLSINEIVIDLLEKLIFRQHRRRVALARRQEWS